MKLWQQVVLLIALAILALFILGPLVGSIELAILIALVAIGIVLIVRRDNRRPPAKR